MTTFLNMQLIIINIFHTISNIQQCKFLQISGRSCRQSKKGMGGRGETTDFWGEEESFI